MLNQLVAAVVPVGHGLLLEGSQDVEQVGPARDDAAIYEEFRGRHGRHHSPGATGGTIKGAGDGPVDRTSGTVGRTRDRDGEVVVRAGLRPIAARQVIGARSSSHNKAPRPQGS